MTWQEHWRSVKTEIKTARIAILIALVSLYVSVFGSPFAEKPKPSLYVSEELAVPTTMIPNGINMSFAVHNPGTVDATLDRARFWMFDDVHHEITPLGPDGLPLSDVERAADGQVLFPPGATKILRPLISKRPTLAAACLGYRSEDGIRGWRFSGYVAERPTPDATVVTFHQAEGADLDFLKQHTHCPI
ncbi:hypothetical protein [Nitrospirillum bahiense]|uniref:Uncharacterized protein n=1 Tax=Nitrospirillum amazonense TaxID=28077 RepID=A0A560FHM8_9PROT|nr:hypothetical protein [Nitrospirillum amazonense]TWB21119.1 hypothetical protein FBZ88_11993 [Nitrospirillum amazonense]